MTKKIVVITVMLIILLVVSCGIYQFINGKCITMQVIEVDVSDESEKVIKEITIKKDEEVNLTKYNGKNVKVLQINEDNVKISRDAKRYEVISVEEMNIKEYLETIVENVEYDKKIAINIDSLKPLGPSYAQAKYYYYIKFIK